MLVPLANPAVNGCAVEAVFLPTRNRPARLGAALEGLAFLPRPPIALISSRSDRAEGMNGHDAEYLYVDEAFQDFYAHLRTTRHPRVRATFPGWDLPLKRSFALGYARRHGYRKILMMDDDIRGYTEGTLASGISLLGDYRMAGCFVDYFEDHSVVDHAAVRAGEDRPPFLSGSFLFINPGTVGSFFPQIYNEDWIFMLPNIVAGAVCSFGRIEQLPYDPFLDVTRAGFEEFGDTIAETLFDAVLDGKYPRRLDKRHWEEALVRRRLRLRDLRRRTEDARMRASLECALRVSESLRAEDCTSYIRAWELDLLDWQAYLQSQS